MHICIIGAGVIGLTSAYFLQSEGHSVTVIERDTAAQLKALVRLGRQLLATNLVLETSPEDGELEFRLARSNELLLTGRIPRGQSDLTLNH